MVGHQEIIRDPGMINQLAGGIDSPRIRGNRETNARKENTAQEICHFERSEKSLMSSNKRRSFASLRMTSW
jgi:hypothetical protein